jgi:glycosyltransferase involved in cell wall biosynthesis
MSMRNSAATVGAAVRSIQLQTLEDWELIVIDDGSSDQSSSIVSGFGDPRIRLVRETSSAGLAPRLNQAVALSRGEFIARMDADDVSFPQRLARQIAQLREDPSLDVLGCGAVVFGNDACLLGELPVGLTHEAITAQPFRGFPFPHPTWCGRAAWFRNNPYDSTYAEDQDLLLRSFRKSKFGALEAVLLGYRQNQVDLKKLMAGRRAFIGSLSRHMRGSDNALPALKGIAMQVLKGAADLTTICLGFNRFSQQSRLKPVRASVVKPWQDLQTNLNLEEKTCDA